MKDTRLVDDWCLGFGDRLTISVALAKMLCGGHNQNWKKVQNYQPYTFLRLGENDLLIVFKVGKTYKIRRDDA